MESTNKGFTLKRYNSIDAIILASFQVDDPTITFEDLKHSGGIGLDENEVEVEFTYEDQKAGIEEQGIWGWVSETKVIHYWMGKDLPIEHLIHFFAHEIGHRIGEPIEDDFQEEMRAEGYGEAATLAYKFAKQVKND